MVGEERRSAEAAGSTPTTGGHTDELFITLADGRRLYEPRTPWSVYTVSLVINVLAMVMPLVIMQTYDRVLPNNARDTLWMMVLALVGIIIFDVVLKTLRSYAIGWTATTFSHQANVEAVRRIAHAPYGMMEKDPIASHVNRLTAISAIGDYHGGVSKLTVIDLPFISIFLVLMAAVGGWLALVPVMVFLVFHAAASRRTAQMRQVIEERAAQDNKKYDFIIEVLSGIHTVKALAMEPQVQRRLERLQKVVTGVTHRMITLSSQTQSAAALYGNISQIVVVAFGAVMVIDNALSIGALACCTLLSGQILQPLSRMISIINERQTVAFKRDEASNLFALPGIKPAVEAPEGRGHVTLRNLTYARNPGEETIFDQINLDVAPGSIIGLRGVNGSGRSVLIRLMRGDLKPLGGTVRLDGVDPALPEQSELRGSVVIVGTHPVVFQGSILDNLTMFELGKYRTQAVEAARLIGLEAAIHRLPDGYDTMIGDGSQLSLAGSFAQQVALARAIARGPRVLVLDEANTILDPKAETGLIQGLEALRGKMTIVLITHRPRLLQVADRQFELADRRLTELVPPPRPPAGGLPDVAAPTLAPVQGAPAPAATRPQQHQPAGAPAPGQA